MGRSGIDLYSQQVGSPFEEVQSFAAYVGGSPANIAVGAQRLGLKTALLTAVGDDPVGDFIVRFLEREEIETRYVARKPGTRSGAVLLAMQPPDRFPLVHYRTAAADRQIGIDDVLAAPIAESRLFLFVGTNLSGGPARDATLFAAEQARLAGTDVVVDLDFRPDQWEDPRAFGVALRSAIRHADVVIGTQNEIRAAGLTGGRIEVSHSQLSEAQVEGELDEAIHRLLELGPKLLVEKRGAAGACVYVPGSDPVAVPGFPVTVQNTLGAGDAFAAGFIFGRLQGWDPARCARIGNACGAIVVTRHACSASTPTFDEIAAFTEPHGGV